MRWKFLKFFLILVLLALIGGGLYIYSKYPFGMKDVEAVKRGEIFDLAKKITKAVKEKDVGLYPISKAVDDEIKWGYIDRNGNVVIKPKFKYAEDFQDNGLAVVQGENEKYGLINTLGHYVLEPSYEFLQEYKEGRLVASWQGNSRIIDEKGQIVAELEKTNMRAFSEGLAVYWKQVDSKSVYGYVDYTGKTVLEAKYEWADDFKKGEALVRKDNGVYSIIDKTGYEKGSFSYSSVSALNDGMLVYKDKSNSSGYIDKMGAIVIPAKFSEAQKFEDGFAIVSMNKDFPWKYGVINKKGDFIIKPEYSSIIYLGEGLFGIGKSENETDYPHDYKYALMNNKGVPISEYVFNNISMFKDGHAQVTKEGEMYFIDTNGAMINTLPAIKGSGYITLSGKLIKAHIDNKTIYMDELGNQIWKSDNSVTFDNGVSIKEEKFKPNKDVIVYYPVITGLENKEAQESINSTLYNTYIPEDIRGIKEEQKLEYTYNSSFKVSYRYKSLLNVCCESYSYYHGAAHGMPSETHLHIDTKTGKVYKLKDLFLSNSNYLSRLSEIIRNRIKIDKDKYFVDEKSFKGIDENQTFSIKKDYLQIYFHPYEIASYADGFPAFDIPYSEISDIINEYGDMWKSFNDGAPEKKQTQTADNQIEISRSKIDELIKNYEQNMIDAINNSKFSIVEPYIAKGSNLYNSQKHLVDNLYSQGIKEKLVDYSIISVKPEPDASKCKVYVKEKIAIQYPEKDYEAKDFSWAYTVLISQDKTYQLSDIEKWDGK